MMCRSMKAPTHLGSGVVVLLGVLAQWSLCSSVPAEPPILKCTSHIPTEPCVASATFHSTKMAPGAGPLVSIIRSLISTLPLSPGCPTWSIGMGFDSSEKAGPDAMSSGQISPVILISLGTLIVEVMT